MFDLSERPLVFIPVEWGVLVPGEGENALAQEHTAKVEVEVEILDNDEIRNLFGAEMGVEEIPEGTDTKKRAQERFNKLVNNWRGVSDKGDSIPFSKRAANRLLNVPGFEAAFVTAYLSACAGKVKLREGN